MSDVKVLYIPFGKEEYKVIVRFDDQISDVKVEVYSDKDKKDVELKHGDAKKDKPAIHAILNGAGKISFVTTKKDVKSAEVLVVSVPAGAAETVIPILDFSASKGSQVLLTGCKSNNNDVYVSAGNRINLDNNKLSYKSFLPMFCDAIVEGSASGQHKVEIINDTNMRLGIDMKKSGQVVLKHLRSGQYKLEMYNGKRRLVDEMRNIELNRTLDRFFTKVPDAVTNDVQDLRRKILCDKIAARVLSQQPEQKQHLAGQHVDVKSHEMRAAYVTSSADDASVKQLFLESAQPWCIMSSFEGSNFRIEDSARGGAGAKDLQLTSKQREQYEQDSLFVNITTHYQIDSSSGRPSVFNECIKRMGDIIYKYSAYPAQAQHLISYLVPIVHFYKTIQFPGKALSASLHNLMQKFMHTIAIRGGDLKQFEKELSEVFNDFKLGENVTKDMLQTLQQINDKMREKLEKSMTQAKEMVKCEPNVFMRVKKIVQTEVQNTSVLSDALCGANGALKKIASTTV